MIKIVINSHMKNIIKTVEHIHYAVRKPIFSTLKKGLEITNNYVVLRDSEGYTEKYINSWKGDFTAFEARENSFYVDQKLNMDIPDIEQRMNDGILHGLFQKSIYACEAIFNLFRNTKEIKLDDNFVLIFSISSYFHEFDYDRTDMTTVSSSIRFTTIRKKQSWLVENLEEYNQPIMTVNFNKEDLDNIPLQWWKLT